MTNRPHTWQTTPSGQPDSFAHEVVVYDREHNGPRCTVCRFSFCEHCYPQGWQRTCPGPPPAGTEWDWLGDGAGHPTEDDDLEAIPTR